MITTVVPMRLPIERQFHCWCGHSGEVWAEIPVMVGVDDGSTIHPVTVPLCWEHDSVTSWPEHIKTAFFNTIAEDLG